ncbi:MAG: tRNA (adenosine(37)-N6)-dimethylallyltransferase MiaA [Enterobacterales bacterium]|nr:tRNA (adenosine(37)-N6)-dimethylallyltransferase MiaA [Enterobacterales bacterium]
MILSIQKLVIRLHSFVATRLSILIRSITRGNVPLLVGGTMLYFKALKDGLADLPETDPKVRAEVKQRLDEKGIEALHQELASIDAVSAKRLHPNDTQRITRAIEVYQMSGKSLSQLHAEQQTRQLPNPLLSIALAPKERSQLDQRIIQRFEQMMQRGFLQEVEGLYQRGDLNLDCASMRSVGYRQLWQHLAGEMKLDDALDKALIATRQLAKRQYTWLRSWPKIQWFDPLVENERQACLNAIKAFNL